MYEYSNSGTGCLGCFSGLGQPPTRVPRRRTTTAPIPADANATVIEIPASFADQMIQLEQQIRTLPVDQRAGALANMVQQMLAKIRELEAEKNVPIAARTVATFTSHIQTIRALPAGTTKSGAAAALRIQMLNKIRELEALETPARPKPRIPAPPPPTKPLPEPEIPEELPEEVPPEDAFPEDEVEERPAWLIPAVAAGSVIIIGGGVLILVMALKKK